MSLYLKIDQDEASEFFEKYDSLSPLRKKIWNKAVALTNRWKVCNPSQTKIATWCMCSRSAVSEAFRIFKEWGWLALLSRGFKKSKTLLISHSKRQIDVFKRQYFKRVEATHRATYTYSTFKKITSRKTGSLHISEHLKKLNISLDAKLKLSLVSENIFQETKYQCEKKSKTGWKPRDETKYFIGTALGIAKNRGFKLDWPAYYRILGC